MRVTIPSRPMFSEAVLREFVLKFCGKLVVVERNLEKKPQTKEYSLVPTGEHQNMEAVFE